MSCCRVSRIQGRVGDALSLSVLVQPSVDEDGFVFSTVQFAIHVIDIG